MKTRWNFSLNNIIPAIVCSSILCSCGTQIQLESAVPAQVNFGRGSNFTFQASSYTNAENYLIHYLRSIVKEDGYYSADYNNHTAHTIYVNADITKKRKDGYCDYYLQGTISIGASFIRKFKEYLREDRYGELDIENGCYYVARGIMSEITPHSVYYKERVKGNDENPYIEEGAKQCAAGNWVQGRELALKAIEKNDKDPEAHYLLGLIERNDLNYQKSDDCFNKAFSLKKSSKYANAIKKNEALKKNEDAVKQQLGC